ncbi:MAG: type IVB secretion system protein IcmM/DotJ [Gammaproteobacteria bacterium]
MSIKTWNLIKRSKQFYIRTYRKLETVIVFSVIINLGLVLGIVYCYSIRPEPDYYSTYGENAPVPLIAMEEPNYSSNPLLAGDTNEDSEVRAIPQ